MYKYLVIFLLVLSFNACKKEQTSIKTPTKIAGFHIFGTIPSFENKTILLQKRDFNNTYKTVQETTVKDNKFQFTGKTEEPELFYIGFNDFDYKIPVILYNYETVLNINPTDLDKSNIQGSAFQKEYNAYLEGLKKAKNKFVFKTKWIKKNNNSPIAAIVLSEMLGKNKWRLEQNKKAFQSLSKNIKTSNLGKTINTFIVTNEPKVKKEETVAEFSLNPEIDNKIPIKTVVVKKPKTTPKKKLPKRKKAPNFYAESLNGNDLSLDEVRKNAKITLIDFWASWCAPCRAGNPHLVKLYKKYHKNGFNIISVSEDDINKKQAWKNAIQQDGLIWQHVIDDDARVATMFGVKGIPHTVLLDQNGGIIFVKKTPYTIEKKLKEVFGY